MQLDYDPGIDSDHTMRIPSLLGAAVLAACGATGGDPAPEADLPSRGASGWPIAGELVHEPAKSLAFVNGELAVDQTSDADAEAGHPHVHAASGATYHTCDDSICRDGVVVLSPLTGEDQAESRVFDPFVRTVTSPLGRTLWDMWFVSIEAGARASQTTLSFAGSFDGHRWSRYPDNPILSPEGGVASPWVEEQPDGVALYVVTGGKAYRRVRPAP